MRIGCRTGLDKPDASVPIVAAGHLCLAYILTIHCFIWIHMSTRIKASNIWLRFPPADTGDAIGRATLSRLAARLGMSEVETIHYALKQLAKEEIPAYEPDDGGLTARQIAAIRKRVHQGRMKSIKSSLF